MVRLPRLPARIGGSSIGTLSHRDVADAIRRLHYRHEVPSDQFLAEFDKSMRLSDLPDFVTAADVSPDEI